MVGLEIQVGAILPLGRHLFPLKVFVLAPLLFELGFKHFPHALVLRGLLAHLLQMLVEVLPLSLHLLVHFVHFLLKVPLQILEHHVVI